MAHLGLTVWNSATSSDYALREHPNSWKSIGTFLSLLEEPRIKVNQMNSFRLDGRVALVTGALGGIGAAVCRRFVEAGAIVVGSDTPTAEVARRIP